MGCEATGVESTSDLRVNGTTSKLEDNLATLGEKYKTFFPHTEEVNDCNTYLLASPCVDSGRGEKLMSVNCWGGIGRMGVDYGGMGVRMLVSLVSGVQIVENENGMDTYEIAE